MPELIAHTMVLGLSIAMIVSMAAVLNVLRTDVQENFAATMAENVCHSIKLTAEQLRADTQSSAQITLPDKIGGEVYTVTGSGHTVNVESMSATSSCIIGTSPQVTGTTYGKEIRLTLSNNTIVISSV